MKTVTLNPPSFPLHTLNSTRGQRAEAAALLIIQGKFRREKEPLKLKCILYLHIPVTQVSIMPECLKPLTFRREALPFWLLLHKTSCVWDGVCSCQGRAEASVHVLLWPWVSDASQVSAITAFSIYFTFIFFTRGEPCPCLSAAGW